MAYLTDAVMAPALEHRPDDGSDYAMQRAFNTKGNFYDVLGMPGQEYRRARFGLQMTGTMTAGHANSVPDGTSLVYMRRTNSDLCAGFDWAALGSGALVVDVGGGIGSQSLILANTFPRLRFVIQDLESVIIQGGKVRRCSLLRRTRAHSISSSTKGFQVPVNRGASCCRVCPCPFSL
jgi:hypothetical protein